jgi:hypothetical protein
MTSAGDKRGGVKRGGSFHFTDPQMHPLFEACRGLVSYWTRNLRNFQWEKADEHVKRINIALGNTSAPSAELPPLRGECHDAAERREGCYRAVKAERELASANSALEVYRAIEADQSSRSHERDIMAFHPVHAFLILKVRDAILGKNFDDAYHWLYVLDSKQVPHDPFKPWGELEALAAPIVQKEMERGVIEETSLTGGSAPSSERAMNCREAGPGRGRCEPCAKGEYEKCLYTQPSSIGTPVAYMRDMGGGPTFTTSPLMTDDQNWKPLYLHPPVSATGQSDLERELSWTRDQWQRCIDEKNAAARWVDSEKAKADAYEDAARICEEMSYPDEGYAQHHSTDAEWAAIKLEDAAKAIRERKAKVCHVTQVATTDGTAK